MNVLNVLYKLVAPGLRYIFRNRIVGKELDGTSMKLYYDKGQHLGFLFQKKIRYEDPFRVFVLSHIHNGDLVMEIGSNIGQYSLLIGEKIGPSGRLICIEPDSDQMAMLTFNLLKNKVNNAEVLHLAVADTPDSKVFYKDTLTGGRSGSLNEDFTEGHFQGITEVVNVTTLKKLIDQYGDPAFIKVDAEGSESQIFSDVSVLNDSTTYLVEVRKETKDAIFDFFKGSAFHLYILDKMMKEVNHADEIPGFANLLIKKGRMDE
jgi:FkbM family methyltransferase